MSAPVRVEYLSVADVMARTGLARSTAYELMDRVAALAGLDLAARGVGRKLLPLRAWEQWSRDVLAPAAAPSTRPRAARPRPSPSSPAQVDGGAVRPSRVRGAPRG